MTYSFDIFDTCLIRTCGDPQNVFDILARNVLGDDASLNDIADFRLIRKKGEIKAREKSQYDEVTLVEIYNECDFSTFTDIKRNDILLMELEIERTVLVPVHNILNKINKLRSIGNKVIFISDIYFTSDFIKPILTNFGLFKDGDLLYLSSEIRKTKSKGTLFDYVRKDLNQRCFFWVHHGDSFKSDFINPLLKGIIPYRVQNKYSNIQNFFIESECNLLNSPISISAGISRSITLSRRKNKNVELAADLLAPLYVPFVYNILDDARLKGYKRLFFLSRDGYILYRIALSFKDIFPEIEIKYLYVSRKALYLPALNEITFDSVSKILNNCVSTSYLTLFDNLQISFDEDDVSKYTKEQLINKYMPKIYQRWQEQRQLCVSYFEQEGIATRDERTAIVDIRGTRKCQEAINNILEDSGYNRVYAYYLEVLSGRIITRSQDYYSLFCNDYMSNKKLRLLDSSGVFFEKYFCISEFKRTVAYQQDEFNIIKPVFESSIHYDKEAFTIRNINEVVCSEYTKQFIINKCYLDSKLLASIALFNVARFSNDPPYRYLTVFRNLHYNESKEDNTKVIENVILSLVRKSRFAWISGSFKYSFGPFGTLIKNTSLYLYRRFIKNK